MKKSFVLLVTIFIIGLFSLLIFQISFTKNITSNQQTQEYLYTQAKFHLNFFKSLLLEEEFECQKAITLVNTIFKIYTNIQCIDSDGIKSHAIIDIFVELKQNPKNKPEEKTTIYNHPLRLHERFLKKF